jgi:competence protein ComEC
VFVDVEKGGGYWLVDCGDEASAQLTVKPFLAAHGLNRLPDLFLSHGDIRHVGGARFLLETFRPGEIYFSQFRFRSPAYRELQTHLPKAKKLARGSEVKPWTILHPDGADHFSQADDAALVLRANLDGVHILLLSDLGWRGQSKLLERQPDLRADIVVSGVPERGEPLTDSLLEAIHPKLIIVADERFQRSNRQRSKLQQRLARHNAQVLFTRDAGAVTLDIKKGVWTCSSMSSPPRQPEPTVSSDDSLALPQSESEE